MLTIEEEYDQWLENYKILLDQLKAAYRFKNKDKIEFLHKRVLATQVQIAMCASALKEVRNSKTQAVISAPISTHVKVRKHSPVNLKSVDRDGSE